VASLAALVARAAAVRRSVPTWPAWAGPADTDELKLTLVPLG
jgi:hypothetical protein